MIMNFGKLQLKEALPFWNYWNFSDTVCVNIDSVLLSILQNNKVHGFYNAAYKLVLLLVVIPNTINIAIFPSMSQFHISSPDSLRKLNEKYFKFMILTGIPIAVGITLLANKIILLLFGSGYSQSIIALQILIWTIVFTFGSASIVNLLDATNKQLVLTKITSHMCNSEYNTQFNFDSKIQLHRGRFSHCFNKEIIIVYIISFQSS